MISKTEGSRAPSMRTTEPPKRHILLIDDDQDMAEMLAEYLQPEGFVVHIAHNANAGLERAGEGGLVLIILDVMLPDKTGFAVLQEIREKSRIPVVMLTTRSSVADKVSGLEAGADDYIPKPFTPIELLARIRTVLRRGQPSRFGSPFLALDDLILDAGARTVERAGRQIDCTPAEFDTLHALLSSAGEVVTKEHLTRVALGRALSAGDRGVDNLVSALRKKLGPSARGKERFQAIRNTGYVYLHEPQRPAQKEKS
ncbi:MAG TPA: response regulator transcription factor [Acidobacteriaceae bacterium]|nr:response regulator transcription factor [Acidobacteriaceae bacterium]